MASPFMFQPFHPGHLGPRLQTHKDVVQSIFYLNRQLFLVGFSFGREANFNHGHNTRLLTGCCQGVLEDAGTMLSKRMVRAGR